MKKNVAIVLIGIYLSLLILSTGLGVTAERFSLYQSVIVLQGYVAGSSTSLSDGSTAFYLVDGNGTVIGTYSSETYVSDGQIVSVVLLKDTFHFPIIYRPREWQEIYVDETLIDTKEPHTYITIIAIIWAVTFIITIFLAYREWKLRK